MSSEDEAFRLEVELVDLRKLLAKAGIDAAEREVERKFQLVLLEELHHRAKNNLAIVQAIVSQSLKAARTIEGGQKAIENRLAALSRVHDLLLRTTWSTTKLTAIVASAIEPFEALSEGQFNSRISDFDVTAAAVLPLAMILNELCTNAAKYGALSNPGGRVDIAAMVDGNECFHLIWTETNGPPVLAPSSRSFGSKLIEHAFITQLRGVAQLTFDPLGVHYELKAPAAALKVGIPK